MRLLLIMLVIATFATVACGPDERILRSGKETPAPVNASAEQRRSFEQDLADVREADFRFVYVLRRKDRGTLDSEDKKVIREQTVDVNRRISADDNRAVILGSNYLIPEPNMKALAARFIIDDLSSRATNANAAK